MARKRVPTPEELAARGGSKRTVTFRLHQTDHTALLRLAKRAGVGHATLCRRIVEDFIRHHSSKSR